MAIEMNVTTLQRARPISDWHAISSVMNIKLNFCDFILLCWQWSTKWEDEGDESYNRERFEEDSEVLKIKKKKYLSRDRFQIKLVGRAGLNVEGGGGQNRHVGFIVYWKWSEIFYIFIVNMKLTGCFTCLHTAQLIFIFLIQRPK